MIEVLEQLSVIGGKPLDGSFIQPNLETARTKAYDGFTCYCKAERQLYKFVPGTGGQAFQAEVIQANPENFDSLARIGEIETALAGKANTGDVNTALAGKSDNDHHHEASSITGLASSLAGKSDSNHGHTINDITSLAALLDEKASNNSVTTLLGGKADNNHEHSLYATAIAALQALVNGRLSENTMDQTYYRRSGGGEISLLSEDVSYGNGSVKEALDRLLFLPLTIGSFTISPGTTEYEVGETTGEITATWSTAGTPAITAVALLLNNIAIDNTVIDPAATRKTVPAITSTAVASKVLKLRVATTNANNEPVAVEASRTISFKHKIFFANRTTAAAGNEVRSMPGSQYSTTKTVNFANIGTGVCVAVPSTLSLQSAITGNNENLVQNFTLATAVVTCNGVDVNYKIYTYVPAASMNTSLKLTFN